MIHKTQKAATMTTATTKTRILYLLLGLAGLIQGTLVEGPSHTAGKVGSDVEMKCTVSNLDQHALYWQTQTVVDSEFQTLLYSRSQKPPEQDWAELIEGSTYDMMLKDLNFNRSGTYKCNYVAADVFSPQAQLMVLGDMNCGESGGKHNEGSNVPFTCSVKLTGTIEPKLTWFKGDREVAGGKYIEHILEKGEKEPPVYVPRTITYYQNITVDHMSDGEVFTCRLSFDQGTEGNPQPPTYTDSCSISLGVTFGATGIELEPNPSDWSGPKTTDGHMELKVGDKITCSAQGNPKPTIIWYKIEDGVPISRPSGAELLVTEDMRGFNQYECRAENHPNGQPRNAARKIQFFVPGGRAAEAGAITGENGCDVIRNCTALLLAALLASLYLLNHHKH